MIVFLTSIRHPHNATNFRRVESLFETTLRSVCRQSNADFRVIVVCNSIPQINYSDPRVIYHVVDFLPPSSLRRADIGEKVSLTDKGTKLLAGMLLARALDPEYFFIFDADDLISNRIAEYVNSRPGTPGWYVEAGYDLNCTTWRIQRKHGLVRHCGTTLIPNAAHLYRLSRILKFGIDEHSSQERILRTVPLGLISEIFGSHIYMRRYFANHGLTMQPLPFRAATWVLETGENLSMNPGNTAGIPVTQAFCEEFGITQAAIPQQRASLTNYARECMVCFRSRVGWMHSRVFGFPSLRRSISEFEGSNCNCSPDSLLNTDNVRHNGHSA